MKNSEKWLITLAVIQTLGAIEPALKDFTTETMKLIFHIISIISSVAFPLFVVWYVFDIHKRIKKTKEDFNKVTKDHALRLYYIFNCLKYSKNDKVPHSQLSHLTDKDLAEIGFDILRIAEANKNRHKDNEQEILSLSDQSNPAIKGE